MSYIRVIKGDLIHLFEKGHFDAIAHGCNCFKTLASGMSGGIGFTIGNRYTQACLADHETNYADPRKLGTYSVGFSKVHGNKLGYILNCYTQFYPGPDLNLTALRVSLRSVNKNFKGKHIGLPLIGCGIAGGKWKEVKAIIEEVMTDVDVTIVEFKR